MVEILEVEEGTGIIPGLITRGRIGTITLVGIRIRIGVITTIPAKISGEMLRIKGAIKGIGGRIIINGKIGMSSLNRGTRDINCKVSLLETGIMTQETRILDH